MNKLPILFLFIFLLSSVYAMCNSSQVDINSANLTELQEIKHVGNATATKIIAARPFSSVNDLARVKGIGNKTYLSDILSEGLACVNKEGNNSVVEDISKVNETQTNEKINSQVNISYNVQENVANQTQEIVNLTPISTDTQNIKSANNTETLKRNLSFYGLIAICLIFGAVFLSKRKRKNEFN
jgi:hypothetical protein